MNNKSWKTLYEEIVQKIQKIDAEQKKEVEDQTENINTMINNIQSLKDELIQQLENQELDIDKTLSIRELIQKIEDIEGGGGECPDYSSFFEYVGEFTYKPNLMKDYRGEGMGGEFPEMFQLNIIGEWAFSNSKFTGEFPLLPNLAKIGESAFWFSNFTGEFPLLPKLTEIGESAFRFSNFTGEFPLLPKLTEIGMYAFMESNFDKDEDGFVKNYPWWDGISEWMKPIAYRAAMKDIDVPKLMSIIPPGAGEIQVLNKEAKLAQSIRRDEYLEENEPSDINYYISYTEKLKEIGFERDKYGNYVDVVNDKSVIIIPEDIKFLV